MKRIVFLLLIFFCFSFQSDSFKKAQLKFFRVKQAYDEKEKKVLALLKNNGIKRNRLKIYLRAFKRDGIIELWGKNDSDKIFKLLKTYEICESSGLPGPKREQGDYQVPEGYYHIDVFNHNSSYFLSLGINYPNTSDKILGVKGKLGGHIFIHGDCVTVSCLPINDEQIKELYVFCVEARNNAQLTIPITIFPAQMTNTEFKLLVDEYSTDVDRLGLWADLKKGYDIFNETKKLPTIGFLKNGRHIVKK